MLMYVFIHQISQLVQQTVQFYNPGVAHFAAATANHCNLTNLILPGPITAGWAEAVWNEKFAQHLYTWPAVRIETPDLLIHSATWSPWSLML